MYHKNAISVRRISKRSPGSPWADLLVSTESGGSLGLDPPAPNFSAKLVNDAERTNPADLDLGDSYVDNARLRPKPADLLGIITLRPISALRIQRTRSAGLQLS